MSDKDKRASRGLFNFPDAEAKLAKIATKSITDKNKAQAQAKRNRDVAETAAIYESFAKSFDYDDNDTPTKDSPRRVPVGFEDEDDDAPLPPQEFPKGFTKIGKGSGGFKRYFGAVETSKPKSGPGSLGPVSSGSSRSIVNAFDRPEPPKDSHSSGPRKSLGFSGFSKFGAKGKGKSVAQAFNVSDNEDEAAISQPDAEAKIVRPTIRLAHLPPGSSIAFVKKLIPESLTVEDVKFEPPMPCSANVTDRKSTAAIVTLAQDTPMSDIDAVVSQLQNTYLGYGFYLSLGRHVSTSSTSTGLLTARNLPILGQINQPFGAKKVAESAPSKVGGPKGFAPPSSYNTVAPPSGASSFGMNRNNIYYVPVSPPSDVRILRSINMVLEQLLQHGPEFEALLMSRPEVQKDECWAWLWDARSPGGVWYRWKLWEIITGSGSCSSRRRKFREKYVPLFEDSHAWKVPEKALPFEYTTTIDAFVSDSEYHSDSDSESEILRARQHGMSQGPITGLGTATDGEIAFLNPLEKARLTHLLARLPTATSRLLKGDVARITAFAMTHASRGAAEIVDMIVSNIRTPFALTGAIGPKDLIVDGDTNAHQTDKDKEDTSSTSMVGLYVVSDILAAAGSSSVRHAWRFRQMFEVALKESGVFLALGAIAGQSDWGRLRADRWKRSITGILNQWEGWSIFQAETMEALHKEFQEIAGRKETEEKVREEEEKRKEKDKKESRWKSMEALPVSKKADVTENMDIDDAVGEPMVDSDDETMVTSRLINVDDLSEGGSDAEGEPITEEDLYSDDVEDELVNDNMEGEPMEEEDD